MENKNPNIGLNDVVPDLFTKDPVLDYDLVVFDTDTPPMSSFNKETDLLKLCVSTFSWNNYAFTIHDRKKLLNGNLKAFYRCKYSRSKNCKATLSVVCSIEYVEFNEGDYKRTYHLKNEHTCCQQSYDTPSDEPVNIQAEMRAFVEDRCLVDTGCATLIGRIALDHFHNKYIDRPVVMLTMNQMKAMVYYMRTKEYGDWMGRILNHPLSTVFINDERSFIQFVLMIPVKLKSGNSPNNTDIQKIIGWGHPDLIFQMKHGKVHLFMDCTFKCCPRGFAQCLIMMIYSPAYDTYTPVFYVLLESKSELVYYPAIEQCIGASDWKLDACTVSCDFETGLSNQCKLQFRNAKIVGCLFHWKQALRRKLMKYHIPQSLITTLIGPHGTANLLTEIPIEDIPGKGIAYVRFTTDEGDYVRQMDIFWKYFTNTWLKKYDPNDWNVNGCYNDENIEIVNRTNNPLERFNRQLSEDFSHMHPTMDEFVSVIKKSSNDLYANLQIIQRGRKVANKRKAVTKYVLPDDYINWPNV